ncbi:MAG: type II toxin-antitoxin system VapC family toxin, partial [Chloroflexi bacterium]|nr:type II toxin-antitoxin system VapC family toxin [Chloroflexota bacterium]
MSEATAALVVDASVVAKWYVPESGSDAALALLEADLTLLAPDLLLAEVGNILWRKARQGELTDAHATRIARAFRAEAPVVLWPSSALIETALAVALAFDRSVYEGLYLALALTVGSQLVTADRRLVRALQGTRLEPS